jgi:hypothetical protein
MKVVYDGAPPRQTITLDLRGRTPVEAVTAALEGQGVNYALSMDPTGVHVQTLLVSGTASAGASRPGNEDRRTFARDIPQEPVPQEEPEAVAEEDSGLADTAAGIAAAAGKDAVAPEAPQPPPVETGLGGFSASPFAPQAPPPPQPSPSESSTGSQSKEQPPQPQATPPPFNP